MKRILAIVCVCVLVLSATACNRIQADDDVVKQAEADLAAGEAALEAGNYTEAYARLSAYLSVCDNLDVANLRDKLVYVPAEKIEVGPDNLSYRNTYTYNKAGNLLKKEAGIPGQLVITEYTYDDKERLIQMQEKGDTPQAFTYTYDEKGNCISRRVDIDGTVTTFTYTYDEQRHCLTTKQVDADGSTFLTTNRYDENGNKTYEKVDYADGTWQEQTFTYTADGKRLSESGSGSVGDSYENTYTYNEAGLLVKKTTASGEYTYAYDEAGRLIQSVEPGGYTLSYTYDANGNRLSEKVINADGEWGTVYTYDEQGNMLTLQHGNGEKRSFTYDKNGNKATETYTSIRGQETTWQFNWILCYYPDGLPEEVERLRTAAIGVQPVM